MKFDLSQLDHFKAQFSIKGIIVVFKTTHITLGMCKKHQWYLVLNKRRNYEE